MTQLRSKFDIEDELEPSSLKALPNAFDDNKGELSASKALILSLILHPLCIFLIWAMVMILTFLGIIMPTVKKPDLKNKDIEFTLVTNKEPPINKNTRFRAETNSRAGGKHNPKKAISAPSAPKGAPKKAVAPATPKKASQAPAKQIAKPVQKPAQNIFEKLTQQVKAPEAPAKPTKVTAPTQKPVLKPSASVPKPSMPKITSNPQSPFSIEVPKTSAPQGPVPSASSGTADSGGSPTSGGSATGSSTGRAGMPSPQFSTSKTGSGTGAGSGSRTGSKGSGGSYGTGNMGNPGPGNPSGAPGIDAIKSADWGPYMNDLERRIKRNWTPPKGDASKRVVVLFKIARDGRLLSVRVTKSSGSAASDEAARAAVELTAPFRPLPPEYKESSIEVDFTFDYNVFGTNSYK